LFGENLKENQTWIKYYLVRNEVPPTIKDRIHFLSLDNETVETNIT
jgi:hypothetical protein